MDQDLEQNQKLIFNFQKIFHLKNENKIIIKAEQIISNPINFKNPPLFLLLNNIKIIIIKRINGAIPEYISKYQYPNNI